MQEQKEDPKEITEHIRSLSKREAKRLYRIGDHTWQKIKRGEAVFSPTTRKATLAEDIQAIPTSVREFPHFNTQVRAGRLSLRVEKVQNVLSQNGLSELNARLQFAGYKVETPRPLQVARLRRVLASYPGALTHIDFKTFGILRGAGSDHSVRVGGFVVIDSLTAYAFCYLTKQVRFGVCRYRPCLKLSALYAWVFRNDARDPGHALLDASYHHPELWKRIIHNLYGHSQYIQWDDPQILRELSSRISKLGTPKPKA